MNIAFFIQDISTKGGTERTTIALASQMAKNGDDVTIISAFKSGGDFLYPCDERVKINYLTDWDYSLNLSMVKRLKMVVKLVPLIKKSSIIQQADVVISQKFLASFVLFLSGMSRKSIACEHYRYEMYNKAVRFVRSAIYKRFRSLVVLSKNDAKRFNEDGVWNVAVIENMVSIVPLPYKGVDSKRIISVGRLTYQKGYDLLIEAVALVKEELNGWKLDIFGDGEDRDMLQKMIEEKQLQEIVSLKGFSENIVEEYSKSAFYVLSSRFEGFPMVLLEAMAASLPVVAFDCEEGPRQILNDGGGFLVGKEDVPLLAQTLVKMIQYEKIRSLLSEQASVVAQKYAPQNIYNKWISLIGRYE